MIRNRRRIIQSLHLFSPVDLISAEFELAPEIKTKLTHESWMPCCQSNENGNIAALRARFIAVASIR
jgi:hypothetical protein